MVVSCLVRGLNNEIVVTFRLLTNTITKQEQAVDLSHWPTTTKNLQQGLR
jgi:hypothetical protein